MLDRWTDEQVLEQINTKIDEMGEVDLLDLIEVVGCRCVRPKYSHISRVLTRELADRRLTRDLATGQVRRTREDQGCMGGDCLTEGPHDSSRCSV